MDQTGRLSDRRLPFSEPSATIVWKTLHRHGLADSTILWNALQLHPHYIDNPWSNRTPHSHEVELGAPALRLLLEAFPHAAFVAVGKTAQALLQRMSIPIQTCVRHPANGGASKFAAEIAYLVTDGKR